MERAGCSIQQATAEQWLFGRNFSKYRESSRNNLCLYCNTWLQSCCRCPGDGSLEAGAALLLETSLVAWFEFMGTPECFVLRNTAASTTDQPWAGGVGHLLVCFPAGKAAPTGNTFLALCAFVWRQKRFYGLLLLLPNHRIKHFTCMSYTIFTTYEE